jgi:hypothetical protein
MKRYRYYSLNDHNKETVGILSAHDFDNALKLASQRKQLTEEQFLKIFSLETIIDEKDII